MWVRSTLRRGVKPLWPGGGSGALQKAHSMPGGVAWRRAAANRSEISSVWLRRPRWWSSRACQILRVSIHPRLRQARLVARVFGVAWAPCEVVWSNFCCLDWRKWLVGRRSALQHRVAACIRRLLQACQLSRGMQRCLGRAVFPSSAAFTNADARVWHRCLWLHVVWTRFMST